MTNIAMIPARMGSERLKLKNLALLNGKPLISYAINAAIDSGVFDRIVINSDGEIFKQVADRYGVEFYLRPLELGSSETKSDDVVYDFMLKYPSDIVAWVNPISPLQTGSDLKGVVDYFLEAGLDSLITVKNEQVHCIYEGQPINFSIQGLFAKTQDLTPVQSFVYSTMMWRAQSFQKIYEDTGAALMFGKLGYFPVSASSSFIIKTDEDLMIAESVLKSTDSGGKYRVMYDELADL